MPKLSLSSLATRLRNGCNPVEVAGYGRESTHKGYLTWLLNTSRWLYAKEALVCLIEAVDNESHDGHRKNAIRRIKQWPDEICTEFEKQVGRGRVDLLVRAGNAGVGAQLPIELKTDGTVGKQQLTKMSDDGTPPFGLVFLLGSSSVRDDCMPKTKDRGSFAPLTVEQIIAAWQHLDMPKPGRDWLDALQNEQTRLSNAFEINSSEQHQLKYRDVYRDKKHWYFALLSSVKQELGRSYAEYGQWSLYDIRFKTVLNLDEESQYSWNRVAHDQAQAYWEFNDDVFTLKVKRLGKEECTRNWIRKVQRKISRSRLPIGVTSRKPRAARKGSTWISVWQWTIPFHNASQVADFTIQVIDATHSIVR